MQRTKLIHILSLRIRFAAISEKLIIPSRQVNANRQKHKVTRKVTIPFIAVPGVRTAIDSVYLGSLSNACQVSASAPVQQCAITTTNPVSVQITIVSRKTPREAITPCSHGCFASAAAADMVIVPCPASFDIRPRFTPCASTVPKTPPKNASGLKAPANTLPKKYGIRVKFNIIRSNTTTI